MKKEVALILNDKEEPIGCFKCALVSEKEYKDLCKKTYKLYESKDLEISNMKQEIVLLNNHIDRLEKEIRVLKGEE